jgi:addiction module RelE/StbE family toxin
MTDRAQNKRIEFSPIFTKLFERAPTKIKKALDDALDLFEEDPNHPALRNHPLTGKYAGFRSIDVTENWRALYREEKERIMFADLGTHEELYG